MDLDASRQSPFSETSLDCPPLQDDVDSEEHEVNQFQLKNYVNIDSSARNTQPSLSYQRVTTYDTWLYSRRGVLFVVLSNPEHLPDSSFNSDTTTFGTKKIPNTIIGIIKWFSDQKKDQAPYHIAGVPASQILFQDETKEPQLTLNLSEYDEKEDEAYYRVANIKTTVDTALGTDSKAGQAYQFYIVTHRTDYFKGSNHFRVSLEKTYQQVVGINLVSTEIPVPKLIYENEFAGEGKVRTGFLKIPQRNINVPFYFTENKYHSDIQQALQQGTSAGEVVSLTIPLGDGTLSPPSLFFLETPEKNIKYLSDECLDAGSSLNYQQGSLIWTHLSQEGNSGYQDRLWMIQKATEYQLTLEVSTLHFQSPTSETDGATYSDVYLQNSDGQQSKLGIITQSSTEDETYQIVISSELEQLEASLVGSTIVIENPKIKATILEVEEIGESHLLHLQSVSNVPVSPTSTYPIQLGVYLREDFSIECLDGESPPGGNKEASYLVDGLLEHGEEGQTKVSFSNRDMPFLSSGYQILSIEDLQQEKRSLRLCPVWGVEKTINNSVGLQLKSSNGLQVGDWVKLSLPDSSIWGHIVSQDADRIELHLPWKDEYTGARAIYQQHQGIAIQDQSGFQQTTLGILKHSVQTGDYHLDVIGTYPIENSWIILIQPLEVGEHRETQINVVFETSRNDSIQVKNLQAKDQLKSLETLVTLRYPIRRNIEQGATIRQSYLFLELYPRENFQANRIQVETQIPLDKKLPENCDGCVNWMSNVLLEKNGRTSWATEEPVHIMSVKHIKRNIYELEVDPPLQHHYPWDSYLVIFVDIDMKPCTPSTINYLQRGQWYTALALEEPPEDNFFSGEYRIQGMKGENIPIQGLSRSDEVARQLAEQQNQQRGFQEEIEWLTHPDTHHNVQTVSDVPDRISNYMEGNGSRYMIIEGRYGGRGGRIFPSPEKQQASFPVQHLTWYHHQSCPKTLSSSVSLRSERLPRCLQTKNKVRLRVAPKPTEPDPSTTDSSSKKQKHPLFDYFFMCTPYLDRLDTVTKPLRLPITKSSFQYDEPQLQKLGIFAKIQCRPKSGQPKMFNTFVKTDIELPGVPMEEEIEWIFLWPDGREVDFGTQEVSFTIEIIESHSQLS